MDNKLILSEDQKRLLRKLLSSQSSFEVLHTLAHSIEDNDYLQEEYNYLTSKAGAYDFIFWETLEELTGETINTLYPIENDLTEEERELEAEASDILAKHNKADQ